MSEGDRVCDELRGSLPSLLPPPHSDLWTKNMYLAEDRIVRPLAFSRFQTKPTQSLTNHLDFLKTALLGTSSQKRFFLVTSLPTFRFCRHCSSPFSPSSFPPHPFLPLTPPQHNATHAGRTRHSLGSNLTTSSMVKRFILRWDSFFFPFRIPLSIGSFFREENLVTY